MEQGRAGVAKEVGYLININKLTRKLRMLGACGCVGAEAETQEDGPCLIKASAPGVDIRYMLMPFRTDKGKTDGK